MNCIDQAHGDDWSLYLGDSCEVIKGIPDNSIDFSIFSPPFSNVFVYSNSERDMGNCADDYEFIRHFHFLCEDLFRITRPGHLLACHCTLLQLQKFRDGVIGLKDFRGDLVREFQSVGFVFHSEICIWKDPVVEMQRTKALGLLHAQLKKDSCRVRQGLADYLVIMSKPGDNENPVAHPDGFDPKTYIGEQAPEVATSIDLWQRYASPVWFDINQTRVLNGRAARADKDERHMCPLQLDVIERAIHLWTNPGDSVFTPFAGIGSELFAALNMKRRAIGIELKREYFDQAIENIKVAKESGRRLTLMEVA